MDAHASNTSSAKEVTFALTTGRSGTRFLHHLCRHNVQGAVCRHEPHLDRGNPSLVGRPIYDRLEGRSERRRQLLEQKRRWIDARKCDRYIETSHLFLKSFDDLALDYFPNIRLVHLVRDPLKTALSETNRELMSERLHLPFRTYRGDDGRKYYLWALTGNEPIYDAFDRDEISLFQKYVIQWIEIQNRAIAFVAENDLHDRCYTLHSPVDLNDPDRVGALFDFFGWPLEREQVVIKGGKNRTPGASTVVTQQYEDEFRQVVDHMPSEHLEIFRHEPFTRFDWVSLVQR